MGSGEQGAVSVEGSLRADGLYPRRDDLRAALSMVDREAVIGPAVPLLRRVYRVPMINSLWHIDGHHKLIPWKIPIHGGIDGYSRMIVFLVASTNNRASTMAAAFRKGTESFGWPSRVRADYGKENWEVKAMMEATRGESACPSWCLNDCH